MVPMIASTWDATGILPVLPHEPMFHHMGDFNSTQNDLLDFLAARSGHRRTRVNPLVSTHLPSGTRRYNFTPISTTQSLNAEGVSPSKPTLRRASGAPWVRSPCVPWNRKAVLPQIVRWIASFARCNRVAVDRIHSLPNPGCAAFGSEERALKVERRRRSAELKQRHINLTRRLV